MDTNRRIANRIPVEGAGGVGQLLVQEKTIPVLIVNESAGGLGLVAVHVPDLTPATRVRFRSIVRSVEGRIASLRYVREADGDIYRIGLQWDN